MRKISAVLAATITLVLANPASASTYVALGDSITFGETDLIYRQSNGDRDATGPRGYVSGFADYLATRNNGARPTVLNFAIDGETTGSFVTSAGRTPPVAGRGDQPLQLENLNYDGDQRAQGNLFAQAVATQNAAQNPVTDISVTLGFNNLAALASLPTAQALAAALGALAQYRTEYTGILFNIRSLTPGANLYLLGYYNPFPADPGSPGAPIFNAYGTQLNSIIQGLAVQFGAKYVDTATPFIGREAELTYLDEQPHGYFRDGLFPGVEPIGNVHPNAAGYAVITQQLINASAVPEPASWVMMVLGVGGVGLVMRRRSRTSTRIRFT